MSLLDQLDQKDVWERFYVYKTSLACPKHFAKKLRDFIDRKAYLPIVQKIRDKEPFPLARRSVIAKQISQKKRIVYTYPEEENTVLKLLTWLLLRKYDFLYSSGLYSFRPGKSAKDAVLYLRNTEGIDRMYCYKADLHNYFNSIPVHPMTALLEEILKDDPDLLSFLTGLLCEERVYDRERIITEEKGIMAGTPLSAFYADLYLKDLDKAFEDLKIPYARYSDDLIFFTRTEEERQKYVELVKDFLKDKQLTLNPEKEAYGDPGEGFTFLGFTYRQGITDIAPASVIKMKKKMRRKARALERWRKRKGKDPEAAAKAFIRIFRRKLFEASKDNELSWSHWFFPVINTDESLREIDRYAQQCLRFLLTGRHNKGAFKAGYEDLKALGYETLVHYYYQFKKQERN